jgi:potassium-transporting ATPase potassium-binding subunit
VPILDIVQIAVILALVIAAVKPMGTYMFKVFTGERTFLSPVIAPVERIVYRLTGVDPDGDMTWVGYTGAVLAFSLVSFGFLYILLRVQGWLPLNPGGAPNMEPGLAFNTAVSFMTNTNWQNYAGETSASYLTQMLGLTWHNFVSAAAGIAIAIAFIRGLTRSACRGIGNFWSDLVRATLYILLPLSFVIAIALASQGVIQNFGSYTHVTTLEGATQTIAQGPVASQEAIKELGTNGGGFFNANSAHPFENPTPLTNALEIIAILLIPAGLTYVVGKMAGDTKQGWVLLSAMVVIFVLALATVYGFERAGNPNLTKAGASQVATAGSAGGNMEGKEVRNGIAESALWVNATTSTSCGAVNAAHDSLTPLAGGMAMLNMALGEVIFGGVGSGIYGMLVFAIIAVFIAGLMVGRTPEYLGKKIGPTDMKLASLAVLALEAGILVIAGVATVVPAASASILNPGPHGLSEMLYAATSFVGNNGSAFAGLAGNTAFWNIAGGIGMLVGRFLFIVPVLGIAGSMSCKKVAPPSSGTFPTNGPLFVGLLIGVIVIVGALTFFPAYALGPILEHFFMAAGRLF